MTDSLARIANFGWMLTWLARGAQPDEDGFRALEREHGISHIVNLRLRSELATIERVTRRVLAVHIPVRNDTAPTEEQALRWLDFCADRKPADRIYVHCHAGNGRTSTFCVLTQVARGETLEQAVEQERKYGFDPERKHRLQVEFLRSFIQRAGSGSIKLPDIS